MKRRAASLFILAMWLVCVLSTACGPAFPSSGATFYVDGNHPQAGDSADHSSIDRPWKTLQYAFQQLKPGDTLLIREGTYERCAVRLTQQNGGTRDAPITVRAYPGEKVVLKPDDSIEFHGANWWTFEGLIFEQFTDRCIRLGLHKGLGDRQTVAAEHITIRNCEFRNGTTSVIAMRFARHVLIEGNYFHHVRPGTPFRDDSGQQVGWEVNAVSVKYAGDDIVVRNNRFEDIGSDGVQLGTQSYLSGTRIGAVTIVDNEFWVNRPYEGILGNVGENAIDVKKVEGPVWIADNVIHGFRTTTPRQDASGADGEGITLRFDAKHIVVERNLFYDNTTHLSISQGSMGTPGNTRDFVVRNNIFRGARNNGNEGGVALKVKLAVDVSVYHNTFDDNEIYLMSLEAQGVFKNNVIVGGRPRVSDDSAWDADHNAWAKVERDVPLCLRGGHELWIDDPGLGLDLRPLPGSPLINAGQSVGVPDDFNGDPRSDGSPDLGAFEYERDR